MAWIESHQALKDHPKTQRLARVLGVGIPTAIGHLHCLWWWATEYAADGDLSRYDELDIAIGCMWEGDPEAFVADLVSSRFLDRRPDGGLQIHDWDDYAGRLIDRRAANAERMRAARAAKKTPTRAARATNVHPDEPEDPTHVHAMNGTRDDHEDDTPNAHAPHETDTSNARDDHEGGTNDAHAVNVQDTGDERALHVQRTQHARSGLPNQTKPNHSGSASQTEPPAAPTFVTRTPRQLRSDAEHARRLELYAAWCRGIGLDPDSAEAEIGRTVGFRQLKDGGVIPHDVPTPADFEACTRYVRSQGWRETPPAISDVIKAFTRWVAEGRPEKSEPKPRSMPPPRQPRNMQIHTGDGTDVDWLGERGRRATGSGT